MAHWVAGDVWVSYGLRCERNTPGPSPARVAKDLTVSQEGHHCHKLSDALQGKNLSWTC